MRPANRPVSLQTVGIRDEIKYLTEFRLEPSNTLSMNRKVISAVCLLGLTATYAAALVGPLVAGAPADCCSGSMCTLPHRHPTPAKPDCHASGGSLGDCSMHSCSPPEHRTLGLQPFLLAAPLEINGQAPLAFEAPLPVLFFPAPFADIDSPPPRCASA